MRDTKQVIVIRKDLNMRKGKMCAQSSHASMKVIFDMMRIQTKMTNDGDNIIVERNYILTTKKDSVNGSSFESWIDGLFTKVVVSVDSEQELLDIYKKANENKIPCSLITDAGLTEFNGVPTKTAVAIGPHWSEEIDKITGHLKLL